MTRTRLFTLLGFVLLSLTVPSSAFGQATRTWVSGVGDDANPCSRTAPCKTFAGAISKTANGGEINCLDPGGFGGVTITKSLTISCKYTEGGVLVSGTNAIVVNATANDKVTIKGLDINGIGTGAQTSLTGIKVLSAKVVRIVDNDIYRFRAGIVVAPTSPETRVTIARNDIHDNGIGVIQAPGNNLISFTAMALRNNDIQDNTCGVVNGAFGTNASTPTTTDCGLNTTAATIDKTAVATLYGNGINLNGFGLFTRGGLNAINDLAYNSITNNSSFGIRRADGAAIVRSTSPATNMIQNNVASDAPSTTVPLARKR